MYSKEKKFLFVFLLKLRDFSKAGEKFAKSIANF